MSTETALLSLIRPGEEGRDPSIRQLLLLMLLCRMPPEDRTVRSVAVVLGIAKSGITRAADRLCMNGYLTRERDPADHRSMLMCPTAAGRELVRAFLVECST